MAKTDVTRRTFIKGTVGALAGMASASILSTCDVYNAKKLPTAILGKTGVRIPRIALGLGNRFCAIENEDEAISLLNYALDNGLYYWDTAHAYENKKKGIISEERTGKVVKYRRKELFLSTKVLSRDPDQAMRDIESSLKRLQTDKIDMLKVHSVSTMEDVEEMSQKGKLIDVVKRMKEEGITRFIGFSGHTNAEAMKAMAERGDFDSMLIAMNHYKWDNNPQQRQELAIPAALEKGLGVMLMKVVRPKENIENIKATDLIRFALSLNGPDGLVLGTGSIEIVKSHLAILRNFKPMDEEEKKAMAMALSPFFDHKNLEWMEPQYQDGNWA